MLTTPAQVALCFYILLQNVLRSSQTQSSVTWDITKSIRVFEEGDLSKEELKARIYSRKSSNSLEHRLFYEFERNQTARGVGQELLQVLHILNKTMDTFSTVQLILFWQVDQKEKEVLLSKPNSTVGDEIVNFPNFQLTIAIHPGERLYSRNIWEIWKGVFKLSHLRHALDISNNQNLRLGLGIHNRIEYNPLYTELFSRRSDISTTDISFITYTATLTNPLELENSFTYFKVEVIPKNAFLGIEVAYRPVIQPAAVSFNYNSHFDLQSIYCDPRSTSIIFEVGDSAGSQIKERQTFSVIPHINRNSQLELEYIDLVTMLSLALDGEPKGFNTFLLNHRQWLQLKSNKLVDWLRRYKPVASTSLQVINDLSEKVMSSEEILDFEMDLKNMAAFNESQQTPPAVLEALVFGFTGNESVDYKLNLSGLQNHLVDLSENLKIGCALRKDSFLDVNATQVVNACRNIRGNFYILKLVITLKWYPELPTGYQNADMIKPLEPILKLRHEILSLHQNATVYFQLVTNGVDQVVNSEVSVRLSKTDLNKSLHCQPVLQVLNKLFVAIISWANGYSFPIILNSALTRNYVFLESSGEWLSFLRKVPHAKLRNKNCQKGLQYTFPISENYKTDACVDWSEVKPEITKEYFNNNNIGTVFHTDDVHSNGTAVGDVFHTMLQFIFHGFRLIEIVSSSNFSDVLSAMVSASKMDSAFSMNSTVLINYVASENESNVELRKYANFLEELENPIIKGIHVSFKQPLKNMFKEKMRKKKLPTKFGVLVSIDEFFELIQFPVETTSTKFDEQVLQFLKDIDYVVFYEKVDLKPMAWYDKPDLQRIFNKHLNYKRIIQSVLSNLEVYFHIDLDIELSSDANKIKEYLVVISRFKAFSTAHNFGYLMVEAFDNDVDRTNGWWATKSGGNPADPKSYTEKEAEFSGRYMWYPPTFIPQRESFEINNHSPLLIIGLAVSFVLLLIFATVGSIFFVHYRKLRQYLSNEEVEEFIKGRNTIQNQHDANTAMCDAESKMFNQIYELQKTDIIVESAKILGMGNFGTVFKGEVKGFPAAIKQPNKDCPKGTFKSVLIEIKVLCYIGMHSNVVGFIGAYTKEIQQGILFIATELCSNGSLEKLLRSKRSVISEQDEGRYQTSQLENILRFSDLHRFSKEIANGMEYIESKNIVHGDLSARNVLLDENLTCKIGDFGLSRKLYEYQKYVKKSQEPLPWKWMAVESLAKMEFTSKSDVWSFGITIWEIYSLGDSPYAGLNWTVDFVDELRNGLRLGIPQFATQNIYDIMLTCWNLDIDQRPSFTTLCNLLRQLCNTQYLVLGEQ